MLTILKPSEATPKPASSHILHHPEMPLPTIGDAA